MKSYSTILLVLIIAFIVDNTKAEPDCDCIYKHCSALFESIEGVSINKPIFSQTYKENLKKPPFDGNSVNTQSYTAETFALYMDSFIQSPKEKPEENNTTKPENSAGKLSTQIKNIILKFCENFKNDKENCSESIREPIFFLNSLKELYTTLVGNEPSDAKFEEKCGKST